MSIIKYNHQERIMNLIKILKSLADENRLRIINLLCQKELCVCELESILNMTQSNVSRHLIKLKDAELIESEKSGQFVIYRINQEALARYLFLKNLCDQELPQLKKAQLDDNKMNELNETGLKIIRETCHCK
jgi:ArsR family transcriptional regulator